MATRKNSALTVEPIKTNYTLRAARALHLLRAMHPQLEGTLHEQPLLAAFELLERVPHALNNAEARHCLDKAKRLLPGIVGLTDPRVGY